MSIRSDEIKIVRQFVKDALKAGHSLSVSLERGYDTDSMLLGSRDAEKIVKEAFAGDECHIFVHSKDAAPLIDDKVNSLGWIYFVFGNSGYDVISDYTTNLEKLLKKSLRLSEKLEEPA